MTPFSHRQNALSPEEDERVREGARALLKQYPSQRQLAIAIDVGATTLSRHLAGFPAGPELAARIAAGLKRDVNDLLGRRSAHLTEPRLRDLPGWTEAEALARAKYKYIPANAWEAAGNLRTATPPKFVDVELVLNFATGWARVLSGEGDETDQWAAELEKKRK